jgi:hypothetical protein
MSYAEEFRKALERTRSWSLWCAGAASGLPHAVVPATPALDEVLETLPPPADRLADSAGVHFGVLLQMHAFGWETIPALTIGDVEVDGQPRCQVTMEQLRRRLELGREGAESIDVHVWLTFPDATLLDATLGAGLESVAGVPGLDASLAIVGRPEQLAPHLRYRPMLVGEKCLVGLGAVVDWASDMLGGFQTP